MKQGLNGTLQDLMDRNMEEGLLGMACSVGAHPIGGFCKGSQALPDVKLMGCKSHNELPGSYGGNLWGSSCGLNVESLKFHATLVSMV